MILLLKILLCCLFAATLILFILTTIALIYVARNDFDEDIIDDLNNRD